MTRYGILLVLLAAGCSTTRTGVPPLAPAPIAASYRIGCPDVLDVSFASQPMSDAIASVDVDGRLPLPGIAPPRVEGLTVSEAREAIAQATNLEIEEVTVSVAEPRSARVIVSGPDNRRATMLPYPGPMPVLDFLRQTGTIPPASSKLNRVYVLRSNVAAGTPPRLFHVDVEAVLLDSDNATNLPLEPNDHVYIGETRRSSLSRLMPDWLKPLYRKLVGLLPESLR